VTYLITRGVDLTLPENEGLIPGDTQAQKAASAAQLEQLRRSYDRAFAVVSGVAQIPVAELAIVTFLMAKAYGKPLVLVPAVLIGRFQHPFIVYNAERGPLSPGDLAGRRVGIRSSFPSRNTKLFLRYDC